MVRSTIDGSAWRRFATRFAVALHDAGAPAPTVEDEVTRVLAARGVEATVMATPTALWVDVDGSRVVRLEPGQTHLARQVELRTLGDRVADGLDPDRATSEVGRLVLRRGPWAPSVETLAFATSTGAAALLLGGSVNDGLAAAVLGWLAATVGGALHARPGWARLADGLTAFVVGGLAQVSTAGGVDAPRAALAAIVVLAPGMALTTSVAEVASGHLTSGTARLSGAVVTLVQLAAGLAVAAAIVPAFPELVAVSPAPQWLVGAAHALLPVALAVLGRTRPVDVPLAVAVAGGAWGLAIGLQGPLGALAGATLAVGLANGLERLRRVPAGVFSGPALYLLVPGSFGVNGLRAVIGGGGDGGAFGWTVATTVVALVAGMLLGHALVRPRVDAATARR